MLHNTMEFKKLQLHIKGTLMIKVTELKIRKQEKIDPLQIHNGYYLKNV